MFSYCFSLDNTDFIESEKDFIDLEISRELEIGGKIITITLPNVTHTDPTQCTQTMISLESYEEMFG